MAGKKGVGSLFLCGSRPGGPFGQRFFGGQECRGGGGGNGCANCTARAGVSIPAAGERWLRRGHHVQYRPNHWRWGEQYRPDTCIVTLNVRSLHREDIDLIEWHLNRAMGIVNSMDGIRVERFGEFRSPPKPLDKKSKQLLDVIIAAGTEIGLTLTHKPSGGTCDGNKLAAAGLPVIDSMGPRGGNLHSVDEFVLVDSLVGKGETVAADAWETGGAGETRMTKSE